MSFVSEYTLSNARRWQCRFSSGLALIPRVQEALENLALDSGLHLDSAYASLLRSATALADIRLVHRHAAARRHDTRTFLGNVLVQTYGKSGDVAAAKVAFDNIWDRNVYSWNMLITAFSQNGHPRTALDTFFAMDGDAVIPNRVTLLAALGACADLADPKALCSIQDQVRRLGFDSDKVLCNALVSAYGKCGSVDEARRVFESIPEKDVVSWTSMIGVCAQREGHAAGAIQYFRKMDVKPSEVTYVHLLDACSSLGDLVEGRKIHAAIRASGFEAQVVEGRRIANALVNMYGKCGSVEDAEEIFRCMQFKEISAWNTMVAVYAQGGDGEAALRVLRRMDLEGVKANHITFTSAISACSSRKMLGEGEKLHQRVASEGMLKSHITLENSLITMFSRCMSLEAAYRAFTGVATKNTQSWNAIIAACVQHGEFDRAVRLFRQMSARQNEVTYVCVLGACCNAGYLAEGAEVHRMIVSGGFEQDAAVGSALVNMYCKCGSLEDARSVFYRLERKTVFSWTAMIDASVQCGLGNDGIRLFQQMELEGLKPTDITFITVLGACAATGAFSQGRSVHARIEASACLSDVVLVALVNLYGKCAKVELARSLFDRIQWKRPVAWNAMISAYAQQGCGVEALCLFYNMALEGGEVNAITFMSVFYACSHEGLGEKPWEFFQSMTSDYGIAPTAEHHGTMVDLLARQGHLSRAEELIESMPFHADAVAWTSLLGACKTQSDCERGARVASKVFEMERENSGAPYSLLTNIYSEAGKADEAYRICKLMEARGARRQTGRSFIEVNRRIYDFVAGDTRHPKNEQIRAELQRLHSQMKVHEGYHPDKKLVLHSVEEKEKENLLAFHSERLAVAFGIISSPGGTTVQVVKNLRVCSDCHAAIKLISRITQRKIVLRDVSRFHHFQNGLCSCKDYW